jgi:hypothetical protein
MSEYAYRKIDIDALDEDVILPSDLYDPDPRGVQGVLSEAQRKSGEVRGLVSKYVMAVTLSGPYREARILLVLRVVL